jgi:DNA-binding NarL/FixJ family response regulator
MKKLEPIKNMTVNIILATSHQDRLVSWMKGLDGIVCTTSIIVRLDILGDEVVRIKPQVLLLDFDLLGLNCSNSAVILRSLCAETKTIVLNGGISEDMEWELLKAGVRGCCRRDVNPEYLKQVVMAIQNGEMWIRRTLTCRLLDELGKTTSKNKAYRATLGLLNKLTQREYDIAVLVANGESNKQVAQSCAITERTVKAHLTEIYLKLGVTDRLNLALALSADNRSVPPNSDRTANDDISQHMPLGGSRVYDSNS